MGTRDRAFIQFYQIIGTIMEKSYILGKDSSLEESIEKFEKAFKTIGINIEIMSWLNPVKDVWSVHIRDKKCPQCYTNGKGSTQKSALASAYGEFFERISTNFFFSDYYLGQSFKKMNYYFDPNEMWFNPLSDKDRILNDELKNFYDPSDSLSFSDLIDRNSMNSEKGICCLPFTRERDKQKTYFPVNIIGNLYVSNGMAAGNTAEEAKVQALSEIIERYVKNEIIKNEMTLPDISGDEIAKYPKIAIAIEELEAFGFSVLVKDASLGGKFPVVNITLINSENGGCFAAFGAHPKFEVALERTLTELLQGRKLNDLGQFKVPSFESSEVSNYYNLEEHFIDSAGLLSWKFFKKTSNFDFSCWNIDYTTSGELNYLVDLIHSLDKDIYIAEYNHLGIYTCRVVIPGISEIYPVDDLEFANNNSFAEFSIDIMNLKNLCDDEKSDLLNRLDEYDIDDDAIVGDLVGLVVDSKSILNGFSIKELKFLLAIDLRFLDEALELSRELTASSWSGEKEASKKKHFYKAFESYLAMECNEEDFEGEYQENFYKIFGSDTCSNIEKVLSDGSFYNFPVMSNDELSGLDNHKNLIDLYIKVNKLKEK